MTCFDICETPQALEMRDARERRVVKLQVGLEVSRSAVSVELKEARLVELFKQHLALQDALLAELLHRHARAGLCGGERGASAERDRL
jgi:hypothetical protein